MENTCNILINTCRNNTIVWEALSQLAGVFHRGIWFKLNIKPSFNFNTIYGKITFPIVQNSITSDQNDKKIFFYPKSYYQSKLINLSQGIQNIYLIFQMLILIYL